MVKPSCGLFVVVEGPDASGKTTLVRRLASAYTREGRTVTCVREPGGTRVSEMAREILLDPRVSPGPRAELFLYLAARAQLVDEVVTPALMRGDLVFADRFSLSTMAYQVGGRRLPARAVVAADRLARAGLTPDLTIVLTVTEADAKHRKAKTPHVADRIERESQEFFRRVRAEYKRRGERTAGCVLIDSSIGANAVFKVAKRRIDGRLSR